MATLKELREAAFMSQRDLAATSGVSTATIAALERGHAELPRGEVGGRKASR
jgi:DNA-binding XRE family transcriptional regulator